MIIAQHFSAGFSALKINREKGRLKTTMVVRDHFSRPFHGLLRHSETQPSTEVLGYSHSVRFTASHSFRLGVLSVPWRLGGFLFFDGK